MRGVVEARLQPDQSVVSQNKKIANRPHTIRDALPD
jgi:hypothetical protein